MYPNVEFFLLPLSLDGNVCIRRENFYCYIHILTAAFEFNWDSEANQLYYYLLPVLIRYYWFIILTLFIYLEKDIRQL